MKTLSVVTACLAAIPAASPANLNPSPSGDPIDLAKVRINARAEEAREKDISLPVLAKGDAHRKEIALTFDDGPHPAWTPRLLDLLRSLDVRATFFLVGKMVDKYPELVMREVAEGHEVANHTYNHPNLTRLNRQQVEAELRKGAEAIRRAVGFAPAFFRPPGGQYDATTFQAAHNLKITPVLWTANSKDFLHPSPDVLEQRLLSSNEHGGILLCHDGIEETMDVLPDLVKRLRAKGYEFVTVSELARHCRNQAAAVSGTDR